MRLSKNRGLLFLCYCYFGLIGFSLGMRTSVFYFLQQTYLESYSPIANMILISGICMQISLYLSGHMIRRVGYKSLLKIGMAAYAAAILMIVFVSSFIYFAVIYTLLMAAYGILVIILNLYVSVLDPKRKSNNLMMLHLFFCLGALLGPQWISSFTGMGLSWQMVMALATLPMVAVLWLTLRIDGPERGPVEDWRNQEQTRIPRNKKPVLTVIFILVFMSSQVWEYGIGTWFVIFGADQGSNTRNSAMMLTIFYAMYPLVRLVLARMIDRFDLLWLLIVAYAYTSLCSVLAMVSGNLLFYSMTGAGVAVMYPALMAFMQDTLGGSTEQKIGFITMVGGLIQYVAIWSVGLISDSYGIAVGFNSMTIYLLIGTAGLLVIKALLNYEIEEAI